MTAPLSLTQPIVRGCAKDSDALDVLKVAAEQDVAVSFGQQRLLISKRDGLILAIYKDEPQP